MCGLPPSSFPLNSPPLLSFYTVNHISIHQFIKGLLITVNGEETQMSGEGDEGGNAPAPLDYFVT